MKRIKKIGICLLCMLLALPMQSCMVFYDSGYPYEVEAEKKGEALAKAIQEKDVAAIEGLFSTFAKNHIKDFDGKVEELIRFMDGDIQSVESGVMGGSSSSGEDMYRSVTILVEIKTDQDKYEIQFSDLVESEEDSKIGLYYLEIKSVKTDDSDAWNAGPGGAVPGMMCFYDTKKIQSGEETQKKGEIIARALKERDASAIKELFSAYAKNEIKDMDGKIEKWLNFMKGEVVSTKVYTTFGYSYNGYEEVYTRNWVRIKVKTSKGEYIITATDCVSEEQEDKLGILYLEMINKKDIEGQDWTIYRDKPEIRYLTDVPEDDRPSSYDW